MLLVPKFSTAQEITSNYFEFHNDYWINLHHYLYQQAKGSQGRKLAEDGFSFLPIGEDSIIQQLNSDDKQKLDRAIEYYRENLTDKSLVRALSAMRYWLQQQEIGKSIVDTTYSNEFTMVLNEASDVYRLSLWPLHRAINSKVLLEHIENIQRYESLVIKKMEELAVYPWPGKKKVRVDLTVYANYAGAYTSTRPEMNIFLSTRDPLNNTTSFVETIFHEGSHLLFRIQDSPFRGSIFSLSEEMGLEFPRGLWHAAMFYLSGRVVQDALRKEGIDHKMDMDVRGIFPGYNTPGFREILERYYQGEQDLDQTARALLEDLN